jgi:hypothetical protein
MPVALHVGVVGGGDEPVVLRILQPAIAGNAVQPAGKFVALVVEGHRETLPRRIEHLRRGVGRHGGREIGGVALVQGVAVQERARAVLGHMAARAALDVQPGEERVLPLATFHPADVRGGILFQVRAFVPDAGERMIAALANGPYHDAHRLACALDVERRVMQPRAGHEQERAKVADRLPGGCGWHCQMARARAAGKSAYVASGPSPQ